MSVNRAAAASSGRLRSTEVREAEAITREDVEEEGSASRRDAGRDNHDGAEGDGKRDMLQLIHTVSTFLCSVKKNGEELASGFQRIPNRRVLPDYFEIISDPVAFSTVRSKVKKKQYSHFAEFVKDVAQICHNAQVYNRPSAPIFGAAVRLRDVFRDELKKLVDRGDISADDATMPDLGELPPAEESSSRESEAGEVDDDEEGDEEGDEEVEEEDGSDGEEEDEDDDDEEDFDGENGSRRRRQQHRRGGRQRPSSVHEDRDNDDDDDDAHKIRGRPPMALTPMEARISSLLEGLRKFKDSGGRLLILPFEKLPDKVSVPDYYQTITNPIALDNIKKKAKQKMYHSIDQVLADIELMFENAKLYNKDGSDVFQAAVELQAQARSLAEQEKNRPDEDFRDEDGKLPLAEVQYSGEVWRVGDWVHIRNPNDPAKPIVAQVFRTWQDRAVQKWINACWYYRPEQTVHRHEKHFYEHEVVQTGQYRDHQIGDVLDRCFVMFVTRFDKGRPRGLAVGKAVYVCESRYNEERFRFDKIKTWASCMPEEAGENDYEMDLFEAPRRMKKIPSPIKHLLRGDAKETDELPRPIWGSPNAPPIIGAVHRRLPEPNESPPPEPTPPPLPASAAVDVRSSMGPAAEAIPRGPFHGAGLAPPSGHYSAQMAPQFRPATPAALGVSPVHQTPVPIPHPPHHAAPAPQHMPIRPMHYQPPHQHLQHHQHQHQLQQQLPQAGYASSYSSANAAHQQPLGTPLAAGSSSQVQPQPTRATFASVPGHVAPHPTPHKPPRPPEVYTLTDDANETLPSVIRRGFQHDEAGRVLFFTAPPLDRYHKGLSPESACLGHSVRYLAGRNVWLAERDKKRKRRDEATSEGVVSTQKRTTRDEVSAADAADNVVRQAANAMDEWFRQLDHETDAWRANSGLGGWRNVT